MVHYAPFLENNTPCSLPTANTNVSAGDTVFLKAGDYINPK